MLKEWPRSKKCCG